jgi:hypothetical protein
MEPSTCSTDGNLMKISVWLSRKAACVGGREIGRWEKAAGCMGSLLALKLCVSL